MRGIPFDALNLGDSIRVIVGDEHFLGTYDGIEKCNGIYVLRLYLNAPPPPCRLFEIPTDEIEQINRERHGQAA